MVKQPRAAAPVRGRAVPRPSACALRGSAGLERAAPTGRRRARFGVADDVFAALVGRHGGETPAVLELASGRPELLEPLVPGLPHLRVEALWAVRHEMAMTVDDVLSRRTRSVLRRARAAADAAPGVAELLAPEWGRDAAEAARGRGRLRRAGPARPGPRRARPREHAPRDAAAHPGHAHRRRPRRR